MNEFGEVYKPKKRKEGSHCRACAGYGYLTNWHGAKVECDKCKGTGKK